MDNNKQKTVLILAANPTSTLRLRLDEEVREIENGLQVAKHREQFKLVHKWAVRSRDFYRAILEHQPQIVHFCGHGAGVDGIVLEDDTGQPSLVEKEALARLFKLFAVKGVECVVLNACYSEEQAQAISQYIKYVIGMNQAIADKAAVAFAVAFYDALAAGEEVEFAYGLGCSQLVRLGEHQTPVLKKTLIHKADIQFVAGDIPPNPYQGLSAFGEKDAEFFFGREKVTNELFEIAHRQQLVAVIGASGSGKSSVVFAGLIPRLREEGTWLIESFRPKSQPFDELALALVRQLEPNLDGVEKTIKVGKLAESLKKGEVKLHQIASQILENKPHKQLLLFADQFEELYTQCLDKEEQQRFIDTLLAAVHQKSVTLVFTLRADFYGYVLSYRPFGEALEKFGHKPLTLMSREELRAAIEQPAQKLSVELQTHLAERILDDVGQEPGNLPLLEFALTQLWSKQNNNSLTHKAYDEIGGVKQALVKHAEDIYRQLSEAQQQRAQRIFLSLVRLGEGTEDTRRVATSKEVDNDNWGLVTYLAGSQARLVVTGRNDKSGEETVEVVHEALIREWGRLREWVDKNKERLIQKRKIEAAAIEWSDRGKSRDYLLQGKQLKDAESFQKTQTVNLALSGLACDLIQKSIRHRRNNNAIRTSLIIPLGLLFLIGLLTERELNKHNNRQILATRKLNTSSAAISRAAQELVRSGESIDSKYDLNGVDFNEGNIIDFRNAKLIGVKLIGVKLVGADLSSAYLRDAYLSGANLERANLSGANLESAKLSGAKLSGANLRDANLRDANLSSAYLRDAYLRDAYLRDANLSGANLSGANLSGANLESANLSGANLNGANLNGANLNGANLSGANLSGADLSGANLESANLKDAEFGCSTTTDQPITECTDLRNAKNLTPEQVKQAKNWQEAEYNPEFRKLQRKFRF
ncbi:nSTAND1 domain-containing NTPase [Scytonema millei]|uniref:nSTAND1 domain-containing NTPase n=1 Tax=Scytonema millei TaxID=1245922 RepID=UPI00398BC74B